MKRIFAVLSILFAIAVSYAPAVQDGFVWDDTALVLRDPLIRSWRLIPEGFNHFLFVDATASDFYRPIQRLTYTLDYVAWAFRPGPYHFANLFWHAAAAIALLFFAEELLLSLGIAERRRRWIAWLAAIIWAIHPINSSAVIYVAGRADLLSAAFGFLGLYLILRSSRAIGNNRLLLLSGAIITFLLAALSKETGLIFPALAMAFFALRKNWIEVTKVLAGTAVLCAAYFSLRMAAEHYPPPVLSPPAPALVRPIIVARAVSEYAGLLLFPLNLHMDRDVESHPSGLSPASIAASAWRELQTLLGIVLIAAFVYWMVRAYKRNFGVFVSLVLFLISYVPMSGLVALNATVAEHWLYLPGAFLLLAGVLQIAAVFETEQGWARSTSARALLCAVALWGLFLGARTFLRTFDWKDERTFFEHTIAHGGDSARMLINLGVLELNTGRLEDAMIHLHAALAKTPEQPFALVNLAAVALKQNDLKLARELLERATKTEAVAAQAHDLLTVLEHKESGTANVLRMRLASRAGTPNWAIEKRYVMLLDETGAHIAAIQELQRCIKREWYRADSWELLGQLLSKAQMRDLAALAFNRAHQYDVHLGANRENQPPPPALPSS